MNTSAIVMLVISILLVWGGLVASVLYLRAKPEVTHGPAADDPDLHDPTQADPV